MTKAESKTMHALWLLKISYGLVLIVAGFDKMPFMNFVTQWQMYLNPLIPTTLSVQPSLFVLVGGIAEMIVGALILIKPRIGAWIAIAWLAAIIINLFSMFTYYDIIVRDALLIVGLLALLLLESAQTDLRKRA